MHVEAINWGWFRFASSQPRGLVIDVTIAFSVHGYDIKEDVVESVQVGSGDGNLYCGEHPP